MRSRPLCPLARCARKCCGRSRHTRTLLRMTRHESYDSCSACCVHVFLSQPGKQNRARRPRRTPRNLGPQVPASPAPALHDASHACVCGQPLYVRACMRAPRINAVAHTTHTGCLSGGRPRMQAHAGVCVGKLGKLGSPAAANVAAALLPALPPAPPSPGTHRAKGLLRPAPAPAD